MAGGGRPDRRGEGTWSPRSRRYTRGWDPQSLLRGPAGLTDTGTAVVAGVLLFVIPAGGAAERAVPTDWEMAKRVPRGVLLLFGGGLSLLAAVGKSGLAAWIGAAFAALGGWPVLLLVGLVKAGVVFLTELTSNMATAAAFLPLMAAVAPVLGADPFLLTIPVALAASRACMLPVATPPNARPALRSLNCRPQSRQRYRR